MGLQMVVGECKESKKHVDLFITCSSSKTLKDQNLMVSLVQAKPSMCMIIISR